MRPVDPKHREIIYKSIPQFGREVYLKNRSKIAPEDRYYFRQSVGLTYGWRLNDSFFDRHRPQYGRVWHLTRDSASRSGPQPDPEHYTEMIFEGANACH